MAARARRARRGQEEDEGEGDDGGGLKSGKQRTLMRTHFKAAAERLKQWSRRRTRCCLVFFSFLCAARVIAHSCTPCAAQAAVHSADALSLFSLAWCSSLFSLSRVLATPRQPRVLLVFERAAAKAAQPPFGAACTCPPFARRCRRAGLPAAGRTCTLQPPAANPCVCRAAIAAAARSERKGAEHGGRVVVGHLLARAPSHARLLQRPARARSVAQRRAKIRHHHRRPRPAASSAAARRRQLCFGGPGERRLFSTVPAAAAALDGSAAAAPNNFGFFVRVLARGSAAFS